MRNYGGLRRRIGRMYLHQGWESCYNCTLYIISSNVQWYYRKPVFGFLNRIKSNTRLNIIESLKYVSSLYLLVYNLVVCFLMRNLV